ncbi:glycosyl hydrolase-like protein, partial [Leptotrombidium deliense]
MLLKLIFVVWQILFLILATSAVRNNKHVDTDINVDLNESYQTFQGFGSFICNHNVFYEHKDREIFLEALYGPSGLQLSVIRSSIDANITDCMTFDFIIVLKDRHEIWIQQQAKQKYNVSRFIASTWSPPYEWKSRKGENTGKNGNHLKSEHYTDFANYLSNFTEEYKKLGLELYAISPQNEPEY